MIKLSILLECAELLEKLHYHHKAFQSSVIDKDLEHWVDILEGQAEFGKLSSREQAFWTLYKKHHAPSHIARLLMALVQSGVTLARFLGLYRNLAINKPQKKGMPIPPGSTGLPFDFPNGLERN